MKATTKTALTVAALVSVLGFGGLMRSVNAEQLPSEIAMTHGRSGNTLSAKFDRDGGAKDTTEARENSKQLQAQNTIQPNSNNRQTEENEGGRGEANEPAEEQQETTQLQSLAKITPQQAQQAAQTALGGKASSVQLENEDGNLVYAVKIGQQEAKVDAGNGKVLYTENANQEGEKQEASRPKSSIQVSNNQVGDRETNDDAK
ncbi:peptidase M4 [Chroococcidiopsis sp. CCALA 051]|uniref:PepSY domain-containing protein n=1 Tax=Chroococcidiopsis sp. CCALA 051 TaxID=869949 RepID=UPI000D0E23F0|nr:PepSY domain-containing protein [Chroococcidiopsis sp. CCALA 051]PSM50350.1 peptidase M4 [Chroococcidiopsis sp. CCALA 051]